MDEVKEKIEKSVALSKEMNEVIKDIILDADLPHVKKLCSLREKFKKDDTLGTGHHVKLLDMLLVPIDALTKEKLEPNSAAKMILDYMEK